MAKTNPIPYGRAGLIATYGNPTGPDGKLSPVWRAANIVPMQIPWPDPYDKMRIAWDLTETTGTIAIHKLCVPDLTAILEAIWNEARARVKKRDGYEESSAYYDKQTMDYLRRVGLDLYGGGFVYRLKRGGSSLSTHSWGCALDLDPERNGMGDTTPAMPLWVVEIFEARGWVWGGRWKGRNCDGMHFQRARGV